MEHLRAKRLGIENPLNAVCSFNRNGPVFERSCSVKNAVDRAEIVSAVRDDTRHCLTLGDIGFEDQNLGTAIFAGNELPNDSRLVGLVSA